MRAYGGVRVNEAALSIEQIAEEIRRNGFVFLKAAETRSLFSERTFEGWRTFAASWDDLGDDAYMADGGRYRRRRHAVFRLADEVLQRLPHQPHYQSRDYNPLNGGIQRWFAPIEDRIATDRVFTEIVALCSRLIARLEPPLNNERRIEAHQFRIEPAPGAEGRPTPEGMHRDGVDWVCVVLINRINVTSGETAIATPNGQSLGAFTLVDPLDLVILDDRRVAHGVTPIRRVNAELPGYRDALVVTFAAAHSHSIVPGGFEVAS